MPSPFFIFIVFIALLLYIVIAYNGFVHNRNQMKQAFASIDVQLKNRWDLIPGLVEVAKGYAAHEKEVLLNLVNARNAASYSNTNLQDRIPLERELARGLSQVMALSEAYPDLKADEIFLNLQRNLTEIESQIAAARRAYNSAVTTWNSRVEMFPSNIFAKSFGFQSADFFQIPQIEQSAPIVSLS